MGTIPVIAAPPGAGQPLPNAYLASIKSAVDFWAATPRVYAYQAVTQSLANNTYAPIALDNNVYDVQMAGDTAGHDVVTNNTRIFIRTPGIYEITGQVQIASNATGLRGAQVRINAGGNPASGTLLILQQTGPAPSASTSVSLIPIEQRFAAGDYVELFGLQASGAALSTVGGMGDTFLRVKLTSS